MPPWLSPPYLDSSGKSTIIASVVIIKDATPQASTRAVHTTLVGSITPCLIKSPYSPVAALNPKPISE
jgi:hypothetical protein